MSKEYDGGIGTTPLFNALKALESVDRTVSELTNMLLQEEHLSSLYDPDKVKPTLPICAQIKTARKRVEDAVDELRRQTNQATAEMNSFKAKVEALRNLFDSVKVDESEIGGPGHC